MNDDDELWERVLALQTFNSDEGSRLVLPAADALPRLKESTPQDRVDAIFALFLRDIMRSVLWPATANLRDVHLGRLAEILRGVAPPAKHLPRELQHDLLLAAHALGPDALRHAAQFLRRVSNAKRPAESISRLKRWTKVPSELLDALEDVLARREAPLQQTEFIVFGSGLFVLARARPASAAVAAVLGRKDAWSATPIFGPSLVALIDLAVGSS